MTDLTGYITSHINLSVGIYVQCVWYTFGYCQFVGQNMFSCEILGFHGSDYEKCSLVGCVAWYPEDKKEVNSHIKLI